MRHELPQVGSEVQLVPSARVLGSACGYPAGIMKTGQLPHWARRMIHLSVPVDPAQRLPPLFTSEAPTAIA